MKAFSKIPISAWSIVLFLSPFSLCCQEMPEVPANLRVSFNGTFMMGSCPDDFKNCSDNGLYRCRYDIGGTGDEIRELNNFHFYKEEQELFNLRIVPGSDLYISNQGFVVFIYTRFHFRKELTLNFYSSTGLFLFSYPCTGGSLFGFSPDGSRFLAGNPSLISIINLMTAKVTTIRGGENFAFSENSKLLAMNSGDVVHLFSDLKEYKTITTGLSYIRQIRISTESDLLAVIDKYHLQVYSLNPGELVFVKSLEGNYSFRDLSISKGNIFTGIHFRYNGESTGILRSYNKRGDLMMDQKKATEHYQVFNEQEKPIKSSPNTYTPITWPFMPFDEVHTVWNHYEQHMSYGTPDWSYLHQGLDIIVPVNEPIYAVEAGWVKCVLTTSGDQYWRIAISPVQVTGYSDGWLYAHLVQSTIQFTVGDHVNLHDYLGNIIYWDLGWGHTHFANIHDHGQVWSYSDEWGINFNPLLALTPITDPVAPVIEPVFTYSKFAFCTNETSNYLDPSNLYGDIDIIIKVSDYMGASPWEQPGYKTYYWVKRIYDNALVFDTTLGQVLNHSYPFYETTHYELYAPLIYKKDNILPPSYWMYEDRDFYQILTNNNGDTILNLSEKNNSFHTTDYPDGNYRVFVEVFDETGNMTTDSMDVVFNNGINGMNSFSGEGGIICKITPNPCSGIAIFEFQLPSGFYDHVHLVICNSLMEIIQIPLNETLHGGQYKTSINSESWREGMYYAILEAGKSRTYAKMVVLR